MPDASDWAALDAAFDRALALDGPDRDAFLASLDEATRTRLGPLLADALREDPLFDRPGAALETLAEALAHDHDVHEGARIGPYRIEALVGEGGMGRVYRARRADGTFEQTVALKVVRQSLMLAGSDVSARLRRERDLLAALDHVGIARLVDGGETDDGVPYLVTEFVDGTPITDYADAHALDVEARVRLMVAVARAVDHAHRRFVVHRDLKPSNVLVAERDGAPRPVVLDFGIAKLLDAAEETAMGAFPLTRTGMRLLTPAYAAPELYDPTTTVTTAADVYGLGALLYELLTGRRPHDDASAAGPATAEPTRPSKAVTTLADGAPAPARVASRSRSLQGDLDTICLKALHPDPARRYASASSLADDMGRYLSGRPVEARPDSVAYVAGRFVRRNRAVVTAGAFALLALVVGLGTSLVSLSREREARAESDLSAERAAEAATLLAAVFISARPEATNGADITVREALDQGLSRIRRVESVPLRGYLFSVVGRAYRGIGNHSRGDSLLVEAVDLLDGSEASAVVVAGSLYDLGRSYGEDGDPAAALPLFLRADSLTRQGAYHDSNVAFNVTRDLSWIYRDLGRPAEAIEWANRSMRLAGRSRNPSRRMMALFELGNSQRLAGRPREAVATMRTVLALSEEIYGPDHNSTALMASQLSDFLVEDGRLDEALPLIFQAARITRRVYGADHFRQVEAMSQVGRVLLQTGRVREAEAYLDSAATVARRIPYGESAQGTRLNLDLARARARLGHHREAEVAGREALHIAEALPSRPEPLRALALAQVGLALYGQGRRADARTTLERAVAAFPRRMSGPEPTWAIDRNEAERTLRALHRGA